MCSLRKFSGDRRLSNSDMPLAKAQRRKVRRGKINILTNDFHVFSPTFAALASLREIFRVSVAAVRRQANLFLPAQSGKKRVLLRLKVFATCANVPIHETSRIRIFLPPRREEREVRINVFSFSLRPLPFDPAQGGEFIEPTSLREIFRFFWLQLRRARPFVVNSHSGFAAAPRSPRRRARSGVLAAESPRRNRPWAASSDT